MKKVGNKLKTAVFALMLAVFGVTTIVAPVYAAGVEDIEFTDPGEDGEPCSLASDIAANKNQWWKMPVETVLDASIAVGTQTFNSVAGGAKSLMCQGLLLWLAVFTLKVVGSMVESDPLENMTKIGGMALKGGFAYAFLNSGFFFSYIFAPVIQAGAGFVNSGVQLTVGADGLSGAKEALIGMATDMSESIAGLGGRADFLQCSSWVHKFELGPIEFTFLDPGPYLLGCMVRIGLFFFMIAYPFYLIDACFRMGVVAALSPLFIVAWVFPVTSNFTSKGFNALLNVAFTFMMLKIIVDICIKLMAMSSGLDGLEDSNVKVYVCKFKMVNFGDVCSGIEKASFMTPIIFLVAVVYSLMLLKKGEELANYFSDTSFKNDGAFKAAQGAGGIVSGAASKGMSAAGAVKDRISLHNDRSAARRVEADRQARASAAASGRPYVAPTGAAARQLEKDKQRLQRKGALRADGSETEKYGQLLQNGKTRTAMRAVENVVSGKAFKVDLPNAGKDVHNFLADTKLGRGLGMSIKTDYKSGAGYSSKFADASEGYSGARSAADVARLNGVRTNLDGKNDSAAKASANANKRLSSCSNERYKNAPAGQRDFDKDMTAHLANEADFRSKMQANPSYADTAEGKKQQKDLMNTAKDLDQRQKTGKFDDFIRSGTKEDRQVKDAERMMAARTKDGTYAKNPAQKAFDQQAVDHMRNKAGFANKEFASPGFANSAVGRAESVQLNSAGRKLTDTLAKDKNLNNAIFMGTTP